MSNILFSICLIMRDRVLLQKQLLFYLLHFAFRTLSNISYNCTTLISKKFNFGLLSVSGNWLLVNYSFHFVLIADQTCLRELRERVASGGDPTKLHEPPTERSTPNEEQGLLDRLHEVFSVVSWVILWIKHNLDFLIMFRITWL